MSLTERFVNKLLCVALAPGQLTAVVRRGGRIDSDSAITIALGEPNWQGALGAFQALLKQLATPMPVTISLSARWCHFAVLPWSDALLDAVSAQQFIAQQFGATFGDAARSWDVQCDDAPYGQPRLACAIERDLAQGLQHIANECGYHCIGIEPQLAAAGRAIAANKPQAFAVVEPGRLVLAAMEKGRISAVQAQPCREGWHTELSQAWQRWTLRAPELSGIDAVALVNLGASNSGAGLPRHFHSAALATPLPPAFMSACITGA
ncbi:MAG: hypothetical protein V4463_12580 [Pseudomonadota bacterium]